MRLETIILTTLLATAMTSSIAQNAAFEQFSYHVVGVIGNNEQVGGTGFFVKKGTDFYLVSAWHCFSFKNHLTMLSSDSVYTSIKDVVVYQNLDDVRAGNYLRLSLFDAKFQNTTYLSIYKNKILLDISAIKFDKVKSFDFNFYDSELISPIENPIVGDSASYYGFPVRAGRQSDIVEFFTGTVTETIFEKEEVTLEIVGYTGCSGAPLLIERGGQRYLWGVLFYALKDSTGRANRCKAVALTSLLDKL